MEKQVIVSDLSGKEVTPEEHVVVKVYDFPEPGRDTLYDVARSELKFLGGRTVARRGRPVRDPGKIATKPVTRGLDAVRGVRR